MAILLLGLLHRVPRTGTKARQAGEKGGDQQGARAGPQKKEFMPTATRQAVE
jgi:hypothetical protein